MSAVRRLTLAAIGLAAAVSFAPPASAGCRVDVNADVATPVASAHVTLWHDEAVDEGTTGQHDISVQVLDLPAAVSGGDETRSGGPGLVESLTGIDVREIACNTLP
jgi:hypothetical protein